MPGPSTGILVYGKTQPNSSLKCLREVRKRKKDRNFFHLDLGGEPVLALPWACVTNLRFLPQNPCGLRQFLTPKRLSQPNFHKRRIQQNSSQKHNSSESNSKPTR
ncbi:hypothetical protein V6Z11_D05G220100 [Gossypium hirsutum]